MSSLAPKPGFDPARINWLGPDQPLIAAGEEHERCSYCGDAIPEDSVPLRLWNQDSWGAVFCDHCQTTWWGVEHHDEPPEPRHEPEVRAAARGSKFDCPRCGAPGATASGCKICGVGPGGNGENLGENPRKPQKS